MRQAIRMNRLVIYLVLGTLIIIFRDTFINYLSLIVGIPMLVLALEGLLYEIVTKSFLNEHNHIGSELLRLILSVIIIFLNNDIRFICIIWGILVIVSSTRELNESIHKFIIKEKIFLTIVSLVESVIQIVFAILLIIEPEEHAEFHLILLGVEMILEALRMLISVINANLKNDNVDIKENPTNL